MDTGVDITIPYDVFTDFDSIFICKHLQEFIRTVGSNHVLTPIGYGIIKKTSLINSVCRSITEQYLIHSLALDFKSDILRVPKLFDLLDNYNYTMEHIYEGLILPRHTWSSHLDLMGVLKDFENYMIHLGYFPCCYTICKLNGLSEYILLDFSLFGSIQCDRVYFKHLSSNVKDTLSLEESRTFYGINIID